MKTQYAFPPAALAFFRIAMGLYLLVHFADLIPFAHELFSDHGLVPDPSIFPNWGILPNVMAWVSDAATAQVLLGGLCGLCVLLILGTPRRLVALLLAYGWACLLNRNVLILNPSMPFVGWALLALAVIPGKEPRWPWRQSADWQEPRAVYWGAWVLLGLGYTMSGLHKLTSPSWLDGTALSHVLSSPLARDHVFNPWLNTFWSGQLMTFMTWGVLALEMLAAPLMLSNRVRPWAWCALTAMQVGILITVNFADLTLGMLLFHLLIFDWRWLNSVARALRPPGLGNRAPKPTAQLSMITAPQ